MELTLFALAAFLAGLVSFLSPCVLPLVPGYVSMLSGVGVEQLKEGNAPRGGLLKSALAFITGFSIVFITLGASASAVGSFLLRNRGLLAPIAGALIILFGLHLIGWLAKISVRMGLAIGVLLLAAASALGLRTGNAVAWLKPIHLIALALVFLLGPSLTRWLNRDVHFRHLGGQPGAVSGFLMGFAFAFGWTPCIGPILTSVLAVAAIRKTIGQGIFLLACYSAGLAIPFLATALGIGRFLKFYQRFRRHLHTVEVCSGILLLAIGSLVFFNQLTRLSGKLSFFQPEDFIAALRTKAASTSVFATSQSHEPTTQKSLPNEPEATFKDLQGKEVSLASLKGKVVIVNFWATWCEPCQVEIPWMINFQKKYADKGFTLLGVAMDEEGQSVVEPYVQKSQFDVEGHSMTMNYPVVLGNDDLADKFGGLIGLPTTYVITREGKIAKRYIGLASEGDLDKLIQSLL
jgi:cytochrome c-type biogenesis protein